MLEKGRAARPPMIAALAPALERAGPLWYRLLPVIRAAKPEVWSCEHSSMDRPTERIVNHLRRCVGKFGHGVTICAGAAARTSTKLGVRDDRGVAAPRARQCSPAHPGSAEGTGSAFGPGRSRLPWLIRAELARWRKRRCGAGDLLPGIRGLERWGRGAGNGSGRRRAGPNA